MRSVYRLVVRLHPPAFRDRFGAEMLCVFDDALKTERGFRLLIDAIHSLLRQNFRSLSARVKGRHKAMQGLRVGGSLLIAPQPPSMNLYRLIVGGAVSFILFVIVCALIGTGRVPSARRQQIYADEINPEQALNPSDLMSVSDECADGVSVGCPAKSEKAPVVSDAAFGDVHSKRDELPFPSGRFGIGQISYSLPPPDALSRGNANENLKLLIWYPASIDPHTSTSVDNVWAYSKSAGKFVETHTVADAAIAGGSERFPLILFSPAAGNESAAYLSQIENLVSHGYIVACIEGPENLNGVPLQESRLTVFEADMRRGFFFPGARSTEAVYARAEGFEQNREAAESMKLRFAFNQIILLATNPSKREPFTGRIDLQHVGAFGHASGGNAIAALCTSDVRISACLDENGWTANGLVAEAHPRELPRQPFLWIDTPLKWPAAAELAYAHMGAAEFRRFAAASASAANRELGLLPGGDYRLSLLAPDLTDKNFTDGPLVWSMKQGRIEDKEARTALAVINVYSRTFFDRYLKNKPAPLLNSSSPFPGVRIQRHGLR